MQISFVGASLRTPSVGRALFLVFALVIHLAMLYAIGDKVDSGEIQNHPEVLRWLFFVGFSLGLCARVCRDFGFWQNTWRGRIMVFVTAYVPIALLSAWMIGLISVA